MMAFVKVNAARYQQVFQNVARRDLQIIEEAVIRNARSLAPRGIKASPSGEPHIQDTLQARTFVSGDRLTMLVGSPLKHAAYVVHGTPAHPIPGRPWIAIKFPDSNRAVVVKVVHHLGSQANDFLFKALTIAMQQFRSIAGGRK